MQKNKLLKIVLSSLALVAASQVQAYTVQEAVAYTLQTSPDLMINVQIREQANKEFRSAYADYLPTVNVNGGTGQENTNNSTTRGGRLDGASYRTMSRREFNATASQLLFDGFGVMHNVSGKKSRVKAAALRVNSSAQEQALLVVDAFIEMHLTRSIVEIAQRNLSAHQTIYGQIEKRSEGGIGRKADLDQALGRLALARSNLLGAQANLRDAETKYLRVVGKIPTDIEKPEMPSAGFPADLEEAINRGLNNNPELVATYHDVDVTRAEYRSARSQFVPRVTLDAGIQRNQNIDGSRGDNDKNFAMLRFNWNVFKGGGDVANLCRIAHKNQEAQEVRNRAHRQVIEQVRYAWNLYDTARRQLVDLKTHRDASYRTREAYQKQFDIGQRTLLDLLDSENELFTASSNYFQGEADVLVGMYRILNAMGTITQYFGIALPKAAVKSADAQFDGSGPFFEKTDKSFDNAI
ncbi:MAG: TolC family outer membrane protein [Candidatus Berkiella sp.]